MKCECCMDCYEIDICNGRCHYKCDVCSFSPNKENNFEIATYKIEPLKDVKYANDVRYNGNLEEYFKAVSECDFTNNTIMILKDMYELIKKLR